MKNKILFTDGSVNTQSSIGYGACLAIPDWDVPLDTIKELIRIKRFDQTSSTKLELQTLLWALTDCSVAETLTVFTDSQNIIGLPGRRERLEQNNFRSKNKGLLKNHELYRSFYERIDTLDCTFVKVRGHQPLSQKSDIEKIFTLVDRAARNALRNNC